MIEREKEFLLELAEKIERLPTMFGEDEVKKLREIADMFTIRGAKVDVKIPDESSLTFYNE